MIQNSGNVRVDCGIIFIAGLILNLDYIGLGQVAHVVSENASQGLATHLNRLAQVVFKSLGLAKQCAQTAKEEGEIREKVYSNPYSR